MYACMYVSANSRELVFGACINGAAKGGRWSGPPTFLEYDPRDLSNNVKLLSPENSGSSWDNIFLAQKVISGGL